MNKRLIAVVALALLLAVLVWGFLRGRREQAAEAEVEAAVQTGERMGVFDGLPAIALTAAEQQASGIRVVPMKSIAYRRANEAVANVMSAADLSSLHAELASAQVQLKAARAKTTASAAQLQRLRLLRSQEQDVSLTELQAAEATVAADQAAADAAQASASAGLQTAALNWGPTLARAVAGNSELFERLVSGQEVLLQVTLPAGESTGSPPRSLTVNTSNGDVAATYLAAATRSDPRLQGMSYFYIAPRGDLRPGTTASVALPSGSEKSGLQVPTASIVWWQGRAWVYTQRDPTHFVRRQLPEGGAMTEGWFVPNDFASKEPIVVAGAQFLFSEELRAQLQGDEG